MKWIKSTVRMKIISANPDAVLRELNRSGITLEDVYYEDELSVLFRLDCRNVLQAVRILEQHRCELIYNDKNSWGQIIQVIGKRWVLLCGIFVVLLLTLYLPGRIFFVHVSGNNRVSSQRIIVAAEKMGLQFGAVRKELRSEMIKNSLLSELPELQWVGINTKGCVAYVSVKERLEGKAHEQLVGISSIVAERDGVIRQLTVSSGTPMCKVGQAVQKGDLLVSGYNDCGICIYGTNSIAEIFADTQRALTVVTPSMFELEPSVEDFRQKYSLLIGKKRIFFYKGSGICDTTCGKMYMEYYLVLPGGFQLPLGLAVETLLDRSLSNVAESDRRSLKIVEDYTEQYLSEQMVAGTVLNGRTTLETSGDVTRLKGVYLCNEMIGKTRYEEIIGEYGETN